ncbi:hypothetical protein Cgig2_013298 [Carnegiea gigantea]|uniref:Uncharacterized protein n=1 Tax=Carnegiea gigantea TaxID=171969 RepID=A0A9Q1JMU2_9CARY|nr:hypothetical protein Cgig2_013298 [Carnegiea gigantea]
MLQNIPFNSYFKSHVIIVQDHKAFLDFPSIIVTVSTLIEELKTEPALKRHLNGGLTLTIHLEVVIQMDRPEEIPRRVNFLKEEGNRRVQANLQLGDVWQAQCDPKAVVQVEPNNVEIVRELARIKNGNCLIDETLQEFQLSSNACYYASDGEQPSY